MKNKNQVQAFHDWADVLYSIVFCPNQGNEIVGETLRFLGINTTLEENKANKKPTKTKITGVVTEVYEAIQKTRRGGFNMWGSSEAIGNFELTERMFDFEAYMWLLQEIYRRIGPKERGKSKIACSLGSYISHLALLYFRENADADQPLFSAGRRDEQVTGDSDDNLEFDEIFSSR